MLVYLFVLFFILPTGKTPDIVESQYIKSQRKGLGWVFLTFINFISFFFYLYQLVLYSHFIACAHCAVLTKFRVRQHHRRYLILLDSSSAKTTRASLRSDHLPENHHSEPFSI